MTLPGRIGRFFALLGVVLLLIFVASDLAGTPRFNIFFWGFTITVIGIVLMRRGRVPSEPSGRFRLLRTLRSGRKKPGRGAAAGSEEQAEE
jgi:hypothetical protein